MQVGDSTCVHCKNNIRNTIAKVNSSQFLVLDNFFRGHRTYFMCIILPQDVQLQLKFSPRLYSFNCIIPGDRLWRAYDTISRELGLRWLKVTPTTSDVFLVDTKGSITPKNSKMVGIYDENVIFYILSITIDSDANNILCQNVGICSSSCKLFPYKLYFTIIFCS